MDVPILMQSLQCRLSGFALACGCRARAADAMNRSAGSYSANPAQQPTVAKTKDAANVATIQRQGSSSLVQSELRCQGLSFHSTTRSLTCWPTKTFTNMTPSSWQEH